MMKNPLSGIYYGWILVSALSLAEMTTWGVLCSSFMLGVVAELIAEQSARRFS
jgi:hypothetical protein